MCFTPITHCIIPFYKSYFGYLRNQNLTQTVLTHSSCEDLFIKLDSDAHVSIKAKRNPEAFSRSEGQMDCVMVAGKWCRQFFNFQDKANYGKRRKVQMGSCLALTLQKCQVLNSNWPFKAGIPRYRIEYCPIVFSFD